MWEKYPSSWDESQIEEFKAWVSWTKEVDAGAWLLLNDFIDKILDDLTEALY